MGRKESNNKKPFLSSTPGKNGNEALYCRVLMGMNHWLWDWHRIENRTGTGWADLLRETQTLGFKFWLTKKQNTYQTFGTHTFRFEIKLSICELCSTKQLQSQEFDTYFAWDPKCSWSHEQTQIEFITYNYILYCLQVSVFNFHIILLVFWIFWIILDITEG